MFLASIIGFALYWVGFLTGGRVAKAKDGDPGSFLGVTTILINSACAGAALVSIIQIFKLAAKHP